MEGKRLERIELRDNLTGQGLILTTLALMSLGVVMVFSAAAGGGGDQPWYQRTHLRQPVFAALGMLLLCVLWRVDYHRLAARPWPRHRALGSVPSPATVLLLAAFVAAAATLVIGQASGGYRRWIRFGPVGFQPSEVVKIGLLVALASMLGRPGARVRSFHRAFLPAAALTGVSLALVVTEDFGTAVIIAVAAGALLVAAEVPWYYLAGLVPFSAGGFYLFVVRVPHRWARIEAMLNPADRSNPAAYQPLQARIAIACGAEPAGLGHGVAKHGYLPECLTDFIFANVCEELGAVGALLLIALLVLWLALACRAAVKAPDRLGALLAGGLGFLVVFQSALHIAVNLGWAPPTGVSLPFVSAGGSSLLMLSAATAIIISVTARRSAEGP